MMDFIINLTIFFGVMLAIASLWAYLFSTENYAKQTYMDRTKVSLCIVIVLLLYRSF